MTIYFEVQPRNDNEELNVSTLKIRHPICGSKELSITKNPATDVRRVTCEVCRLTLEFPMASNLTDFEKVAIDGAKRRLTGNYVCSVDDTDIWIVRPSQA